MDYLNGRNMENHANQGDRNNFFKARPSLPSMYQNYPKHGKLMNNVMNN
jgi:hypothetical protein